MNARVTIDHVSQRGAGRAWRLRDVSTVWERGERIGIVGRNGSGKTSLARILAGLERPSAGRVRWRGAGRRVMLVMQRAEEHLLTATVARELNGYAHRSLSAAESGAMLARVGLASAFLSRPVAALSMGERRALTIACGLATNPDWLLLDEPMAGLDAASRECVMTALGALAESSGLGIALISHHPDDLLGWARRVWLFEDGALVFDGAFTSAPVDRLRHCLDPSTISLYATLRQMDEAGFTVPAALYGRLSDTEVAAGLREANP